jgi:hypothetical protein
VEEGTGRRSHPELPEQTIGTRNTPPGYHLIMDKPSPWPGVTVVVAVVAGLVTLSLAHVDTGALINLVPLLVLPVLGYLGVRIEQVKHQTNGNTSQLISQIDKLTSVLAGGPAQAAATGPDTPNPPAPLDVDSSAPEA